MALLNKSKKVAVALSGGVDSSVAAALLKKQGFDVLGFHMRLWKVKDNKKQQQETEQRVKQVGEVLDIPIKIFDFKKEFKDCVVNYFIDSYKKGITPNPCVVCNAKIKFGLLMKKAKELGCDFLATGHYAQVKNGRLFKARFEQKDQSYFLWQLSQKQLTKILFPLGEIESKQKVRDLAKEFGLPTAKTSESNDVCFLQNTNLNEFLESRIKTNKGKIVSVDGKVLGEHNGLWFYTIGQRKGIGFSAGPWFVAGKDIKKNTLIVSQNEKDLFRKELISQEANWISGTEPRLPLQVLAKIRYGSLPSVAIIKEKIRPKKYKIIFNKPQRAITPGQSVVFYLPRRLVRQSFSVGGSSERAKAGEGNELLGGGVI